MDRAAIYVRVSTDYAAQKDSPDHQLAACKEYAASIGLSTSPDHVYNDAGLSGTEITMRNEVSRMMHDARNGEFEAVLFTAISRFSRDMSDAFNMKKKLESIYGVRLISIEEGYDSAIEGRNNEMVFTVHAMLAAHKSKEMSVAILRGLRQSAKKGRHIGNVTPYGYRKGLDQKLEHEPYEANVIRDIFRLYLSGESARSIAHILNEQHIPTASKRRSGKDTLWQASTITSILHNEVYVGTIVAHRYTTARHTEASRLRDELITKPSKRNESEWITVTQAHDPIIDDTTFQQVQDLFNQKATNRGMKRTSNLLAGLMYCNECGGKMIVTGNTRSSHTQTHQYRYIVCAKTRRIGKSACSNHFITKYDDLLSALLSPLQKLLQSAIAMTPSDDRELLSISQYTSSHLVEAKITQLRKALAHNQHEQIENLRAFRNGIFTKDIIELGQKELTEQAVYLQSEITRLTELVARNHNMIDSIRSQHSVLNIFKHMHLYNSMTQRLALQAVVDQIIFSTNGDISVLFTWQQ
ncbi:MAG: recombinase family protein [Acidibacillus sp.]|nr:recombinase family protein [Acidibacillus sp.]